VRHLIKPDRPVLYLDLESASGPKKRLKAGRLAGEVACEKGRVLEPRN
jgi:hypothetical protein